MPAGLAYLLLLSAAISFRACSRAAGAVLGVAMTELADHHGWILSFSACHCRSTKETVSEIGCLLHDELLGNWWLQSGMTAKGHNPGVSMQGATVGLYCAVVERFDLLVSTCKTAARKTRAVFNQRAESLPKWLGALNFG